DFFDIQKKTRKEQEEKLNLANDTYNRMTENKIQNWQILIDQMSIDKDQIEKLIDMIDKQIIFFLASLDQKNLIDLNSKIDLYFRALDANNKQKQSMNKLAL